MGSGKNLVLNFQAGRGGLTYDETTKKRGEDVDEDR